jgi:signal transduction histidine kinase
VKDIVNILSKIYSRAVSSKGPSTLRVQIVFNFTLVFSILIFIAAATVFFVQKEYLYRSNSEEITALARSLAVSSRSWIMANDVTGLQEVVTAFKDFPEIEYAMIISGDGRVLGHLNEKNQGLFLSDPLSLSLLNSSVGLHVLTDNSEFLDLAWPVVYDSRVIAWSRVAVRRTRIYQNLMMLATGSILFVILSGLISFIVSRLIADRLSKDVTSLSDAAGLITEGRRDIRASAGVSMEMKKLSESLNTMLDDLISSESELRSLNEALEVKVALEVDSNRQKDMLLIQQSRLAAMGEMIHNIAHQWRQPLNSVSLIVQNLQDEFQNNECTIESIDATVTKIMSLLLNMSRTIEDFRSFFRPDKQKEPFSVSAAIDSALTLIDASLHSYGIIIEKNIQSNPEVFGFSNQFSQAILNIISNSKEAIVHEHISPGIIKIDISSEDYQAVIKITDNGGGIKPEVLSRMFEPYFTTKSAGSGIGLYMTKMIVERNMSGNITAQNYETGTRIIIRLPYGNSD